MAQTKSFRVYFVEHVGGLLTGVLIRTWDNFFDTPPPSAIGTSEEDVLRQLDMLVQQLGATSQDTPERYLWEETFSTREVTVIARPQTTVGKRMVIGAKEIPLRFTYAWCELAKGGFRVMLPRFGWWFVLESLSIASEVLRAAVSTSLLGENPRSIYDFRREGDEYVREWSPRFLQSEAESHEHSDTQRMPTVHAVADELVERAARGKLPSVVGDSDDFDQAAAMFHESPLPSILLVGPHGVGKTTFVRRLAKHFLQRRRESPDKTAPRIWSTSATRIIAGMVYVGMWQERCLNLTNELEHEGDYLYLDRLVPILQAQPDGASIGEILLPPIADGSISVLAECTDAEYERCRRRFPSLVDLLRVVRVREPAPYQIPSLLATWHARRSHTVTLHPAGLRRLVRHLTTFQRDTAFPGKGIRFLDWITSSAEPSAPHPPGASTESASATSAASSAAPTPSPGRVLYPRDISELYARHTGLPVELIADERPLGPDDLAATLRRAVIGQDDACGVASRVLARFKAGLNDPERPCGTLFFVGPTGVGKTELARSIARFMYGDEARMIRLDMSEYMFPGSAQRMLEVGSGVTSLAQRVREQPLSLVLFDEIEKAHPEVFDMLLGLLGEGRLTDSFGAVVDFRMTLVVMTSNLGVTESRSAGFSDAPAGASDFLRAVRRHFRPEFFNRIDHVVPFRALSPDDVLKIVDLELARAATRTGLLRRNLRLDVSPAARARLAELGWHPTRGARPLKRVLEDRVVSPVAALLADDPTLRDRTLVVDPEGHVTTAAHDA
jgi:ATP-dependent Clp protease ATP-binding subunit ClpC